MKCSGWFVLFNLSYVHIVKKRTFLPPEQSIMSRNWYITLRNRLPEKITADKCFCNCYVFYNVKWIVHPMTYLKPMDSPNRTAADFVLLLFDAKGLMQFSDHVMLRLRHTCLQENFFLLFRQHLVFSRKRTKSSPVKNYFEPLYRFMAPNKRNLNEFSFMAWRINKV